MRGALAAVLVFFDSEPALARVCLVETLGGRPVVLEQRARVVGAFRALVVEQIAGQVFHSSSVAAEGVLAAVMGVVHARLIARERAPLVELLGPLLGLIVGLYMEGSEVECEIERGNELSRALLAGVHTHGTAARGAVTIPAAMTNPNAYRVRQCLLFLAGHPGASNGQVAAGIGVAHKSQISRLLAYLLREGLVVKRSQGVGTPNVWRLTSRGEEILRAMAAIRLTGRHPLSPLGKTSVSNT
jgi:hypothetical protein